MAYELSYEVHGVKGELLLKVGESVIEIVTIKNPDKPMAIDWQEYHLKDSCFHSAE